MNLCAVVMAVGDGPTDVADQLRALADRVAAGERWVAEGVGPTYVHVRELVDPTTSRSGEEAMTPARFYAVAVPDSEEGEVVALFADLNDAEAYIALRRADLCVLRADVVGTVWNSADPDPHAEEGRER